MLHDFTYTKNKNKTVAALTYVINSYDRGLWGRGLTPGRGHHGGLLGAGNPGGWFPRCV